MVMVLLPLPVSIETPDISFEIAERENRIVVGLIDDLDALNGDRLVVDLLGRLHHLHDEAVIDRRGASLLREIDGQDIGVEQKPRLKRIEHQPLVAACDVRTRRFRRSTATAIAAKRAGGAGWEEDGGRPDGRPNRPVDLNGKATLSS